MVGTVHFPSKGSAAHGYLRMPGSGRGPGVVVIQEWWGLESHLTDVVDRFANEGFSALTSDLYHGEQACLFQRRPVRGSRLLGLKIGVASTVEFLRTHLTGSEPGGHSAVPR